MMAYWAPEVLPELFKLPVAQKILGLYQCAAALADKTTQACVWWHATLRRITRIIQTYLHTPRRHRIREKYSEKAFNKFNKSDLRGVLVNAAATGNVKSSIVY